MSLSRLPQVALRRLMPAITVVPKNLDDDQLKKILEQPPASAKGSLPSKAELSQLTTTPGLISALSKSATSLSTQTSALNSLLKNITGTQGMLSSQDLALLKAVSNTNAAPLLIDSNNKEQRAADKDNNSSGEFLTTEPQQQVASNDYSPLTTPEPASPAPESALLDQEPAVGALDSASVDALISALRGTAAISSEDSAVDATTSAAATSTPPARTRRRATTAAPKHPEPVQESVFEEQTDDELPPISSELSAAERRKEQNRRAQKKFRQKDKVRQKEVKWRASQYDELVASNKRFKADIDTITKERDMYRRILELNGISVSDDMNVVATAVAPASASAAVASSSAVPPLSLSASSAISSVATTESSPVLSSVPNLGMDQLALDTFGVAPQTLPMAHTSSPMGDLLNTLVFGAVKSDPMFGSSGMFSPSPRSSSATVAPIDNAPRNSSNSVQSILNTNTNTNNTSKDLSGYVLGVSPNSQTQQPASWFGTLSPASDALSTDSPLIIDQGSMDAQYSQQSVIDSHFVDPMTFIDELLASPSFTPSSSLPASQSSPAMESLVRKRSYEDAMF